MKKKSKSKKNKIVKSVAKPQKKDPAAELLAMGHKIRLKVLEMSARSSAGETGSSLCISDILAVLFFKVMKINPMLPLDPKRDRFILSKGHAAAAYYAALSLRGYFDEKTLEGHRMNGGLLHAHPSRNSVSGVEVSTGSLGHGLSVACGMAEAIKKTHAKVYVLIGDGECDEGSIWEAANYIGVHAVTNVVAVVDFNGHQGYPLPYTKTPQMLAKIWGAFGWEVSLVNGHDVKALEKAFTKKTSKPHVVIAKTVAGYGVKKIEDTQHAHYFVPKLDDVEEYRKKYA